MRQRLQTCAQFLSWPGQKGKNMQSLWCKSSFNSELSSTKTRTLFDWTIDCTIRQGRSQACPGTWNTRPVTNKFERTFNKRAVKATAVWQLCSRIWWPKFDSKRDRTTPSWEWLVLTATSTQRVRYQSQRKTFTKPWGKHRDREKYSTSSKKGLRKLVQASPSHRYWNLENANDHRLITSNTGSLRVRSLTKHRAIWPIQVQHSER